MCQLLRDGVTFFYKNFILTFNECHSIKNKKSLVKSFKKKKVGQNKKFSVIQFFIYNCVIILDQSPQDNSVGRNMHYYV